MSLPVSILPGMLEVYELNTGIEKFLISNQSSQVADFFIASKLLCVFLNFMLSRAQETFCTRSLRVTKYKEFF
jgi:hypothetical protein